MKNREEQVQGRDADTFFLLDVTEFFRWMSALAAFFHAFMTVCDRHQPHKTSAALHYSPNFPLKVQNKHFKKKNIFRKKKSSAVQICIVFENHSKSLNLQSCERSYFQLHSATFSYFQLLSATWTFFQHETSKKTILSIFKHCDINAVFSGKVKDFCRDLFTQQ